MTDAAQSNAEPSGVWTQTDAIALCRQIEAICPPYGCHVALTGGCLYKDGERKDLDLLFYRIRQVAEIDKPGLFTALEGLGIQRLRGFGWCHKAKLGECPIDVFFPEEDGGDYEADALAGVFTDELEAADAL